MGAISWLLSWFPSWSVTWLAGVLALAGIAGFIWSRLAPLTPHAALAGLLAPLLLLSAAFLAGVGSAQSVQEARHLRRENQILTQRIETEREVRERDAQQAAHDAELNRKNEDVANETPADDRVALPRAAAGRVRQVR